MKSIIMHKILNFIENKNIDEVETIFAGKVENYLYVHLVNKKDQYKKVLNDNTKAWFHFIGDLNNSNSEILFDYINTEN